MQVLLLPSLRLLFLMFSRAAAAETYMESAEMPLLDKDASNAIVYKVQQRAALGFLSLLFTCRCTRVTTSGVWRATAKRSAHTTRVICV
jgi:hypothetical protein